MRFPPSCVALGARRVARALLAAAGVVATSACATTNFDGPDGDRRFYEARCGYCHVAPHPTEHDVAEWPAIVADMAPRAGLSATQRARVLDYVTRR